jgi:hypothetical protein
MKTLELRMAGATFQAIADTLGFENRSSAADVVTRAVGDTVPNKLTDQVRQIENERLDRLWGLMYVRDLKGDDHAVDWLVVTAKALAIGCESASPDASARQASSNKSA